MNSCQIEYDDSVMDVRTAMDFANRFVKDLRWRLHLGRSGFNERIYMYSGQKIIVKKGTGWSFSLTKGQWADRAEFRSIKERREKEGHERDNYFRSME